MSCTGPKRVEVLRDTVTIRGRSGFGSGMPQIRSTGSPRCFFGGFAVTIRMGMATGVLRFGKRFRR